MIQLIALTNRFSMALTRADWLLPSLARLIFAGVLAGYFWNSALTKFDGGPFSLSFGAYAQIFPKAVEAAGGDLGNLGTWRTVIVFAGAWAEAVLPLLIILGLITRLAALGMIGFIAVQSLTDIYGHMVDADTLGAWFDRSSGSLILDQRALWVMLLVVLVMKGAGPLSVDRAFGQWASG